MQAPDHILVYITQHGTRKGPFSVSMLRRMREDQVLKEEEFKSDEWSALMQVLDSEDIQETSFWSRKPLVKIKRQAAKQELGIKRLLLVFTWIGFAIGAFLMGWGILRSEERIPWESPMLGCSVFLAVMFGRTFVGRFVRRALLSGDRKQSAQVAYAQFYRGLVPLLVVVLVSVAVGYFLVPRAAFVQVAINGGICLAAGAVLSMRIPSSYFDRWRYLALSEIEGHSLPWMGLPMLAFLFLILAYNADAIPGANTVVLQAKRLLFRIEPEPEDGEWKLPIRLGSMRSQVEKALGQPERSEEGEQYFSKPGVTVSYTALGRVARLRFDQPVAGERPVAIAWGVTDASTQKELRRFLGPPKSIMSTKTYQVCTWDRPPYRVMAEVWNEDGATHSKGGIKVLEIVGLDAVTADPAP
jgi:hypothetical protein